MLVAVRIAAGVVAAVDTGSGSSSGAQKGRAVPDVVVGCGAFVTKSEVVIVIVVTAAGAAVEV